jgi:hypothetical protein
MIIKLNNLLDDSLYLIDKCKTLEQLEKVRKYILGKNGYLTIILKTIGRLFKNEIL